LGLHIIGTDYQCKSWFTQVLFYPLDLLAEPHSSHQGHFQESVKKQGFWSQNKEELKLILNFE
jgi:hypothetical protein